MGFLSECTSGGCGAKIEPDALGRLTSALPVFFQKDLLVGFSGSEDAAVFRVSDDLAMVSTVDFFSPMVEDPYVFGQIAAANALSDVYAMGAVPLYALNLVCFPQAMDKAVLGRILAGGADKAAEAEISIAGGHSIYDHEPKYGLAVTGKVHPDKILRNNTCRAGDALLLTKPLGTGLVMAALRGGLAQPGHVEAATDSMRRLNRYAAQKLAAFPVHACTDVTGFGLAAHAAEMAGEEHSIVIDTDALPLLPGAKKYASEYLATAAGQRNRNHMEGKLRMEGVAPPMQEILFDPQTSGGLLVSLPAHHAAALLSQLKKDDPAAAIIGMVEERGAWPVMAV